MTPRCPRCKSPATRIDAGNYVCMMGGHLWPINGLKKNKETTAIDLLVAEQVWLTRRLGKVNQAIEILS